MASFGPAGAAVLGLIAVLAVLPPGYAALRAAGVKAGGMAGLGLALGLGYTLVPPLARLEALLGGPYLVAPVLLLSCLWLRPGADVLRGVRGLGLELVPPLAFAALAFAVNRPDFAADAAGLRLRPGFDVGDRVFYATVTQELGRAPFLGVENPVFAGLPLQYAFLPCMLGLLLASYAGAPALLVSLISVPVAGLFCVGVAALGLMEELGAARRARWLTACLIVLGGDLSFLLPASPHPLERFGRMFAFFSFSAQSLFYNPWMFGVPLAFAVLLAGRRFLRQGGRGEAVVAALLLAGLWQTKVFAALALAAAALLAGLLLRRPRLLLLASLAVAAGLPQALAAGATGAGRDGAALLFSPFLLVRAAAANNPSLAALSDSLGLAGLVPVFLIGALGVRVVGVPRLLAEARADRTGFHGWVGMLVALLVGLALAVRGNPTAVEGVQFLLLALTLLWLYAAPVLADLGTRRRAAAALLVVGALLGPLHYFSRKALPALVPSLGPLDISWIEVSPGALSACRYLQAHAPPRARVLAPVTGAGAADSARGLVYAALASRRVVAVAGSFHVGPRLYESRLDAVGRFYGASSTEEAEALLDDLGVSWVWEDAERPLRFRSPRLVVAFDALGVRLYRVGPGSTPTRLQP